MFKKLLAVILASVTFTSTLSHTVLSAAASQKATLSISVVTTRSANDLLKTLNANYSGIKVYSSLDDALNNVKADGTKGIMLLADNYPNSTTAITDAQAAKINELGVRLYIEYPDNNALLGITGYNGIKKMGYDRAIVTDADALGVEIYSLLYVHGAQFAAKTDVTRSWLVNATVAGYDTADFGLSDCTPYSMIELNIKGNVLIASTKLSQFISARYAPYERWQKLWLGVLSWVSQIAVTKIEWTPAVNANYGPNEPLADNAYSEAVRLNVEWYKNNMMSPDGAQGIYQCYGSGSSFNVYGEQSLNSGIRADCNGESIGAIALAGVLLNNREYKTIAYDTMNWMLNESQMANGDRADPNNAQYGLFSWYDNIGDKYLGQYYGDDNAKAIIGLMLGAAALDTDEFDERILEAILANFRTSGIYGFRGSMLSGDDLETNGWEYYYNRSTTNYSSHFESLLWACYLWAYDKTDYMPLYIRAQSAISRMMMAYDNTMEKDIDATADSYEWTWTNGMQQERAKMILPLAWLVRVAPTDQHIEWLDTMITDMMKYQDVSTGALRDVVGEAGEGNGIYGPFTKNSDYGKHESPVIQNNGDPCSDSLYTSSFAMMTLNEAYASVSAAGKSELAVKYKQYAKSLSDYHVRIQQVSDTKSKYNGVWFRGFDYEKWETYGSDGDAGWGIWCTETGWSQAQISSALSLQALNTNIWDYTKGTTVDKYFADTAVDMLGCDPRDFEDNETVNNNPETQNNSSTYTNSTDNSEQQNTTDGTTGENIEIITEEIIQDVENEFPDNKPKSKIWLWIALAVVIVGAIVASVFCIKKFVHKETNDTLISENVDKQEEKSQNDN